ncbi:MAG: FkbM family methyltransferase [Gammaproteobacteria bacterium]|nr:FkbM family methyltransferase [Pseudomonadales bacterium]
MNISHSVCKFLWNQPWFKPEQGRSIYKKLCQRGEAPDFPFEKDFFGLRYAGNLQNNIDFNVFYYGAFEKPLLFFLRDCLAAIQSPPVVCCDIGANIGQHSLFLSQLADQVHAFEPYKKVRDRLEQQIALNRIDNLTVHPVGLSDQRQSLPFFAPTGHNEGIGSFDARTTKKGNRSIGELTLERGDDYFELHGIRSIDLMKVDVEGFEKSVLTGLRHILERDRPVVVCEITYGSELSITSLEELVALFPKHYEFFTFDVRKPDGSKARRREARARQSGAYHLVPFDFRFQKGQDDIIACPVEKLEKLPRSNA